MRLREEAAKFDERRSGGESIAKSIDTVYSDEVRPLAPGPGLPLAPRQGALAQGERRERRGAAGRAPELLHVRRARPAGGGGQGGSLIEGILLKCPL